MIKTAHEICDARLGEADFRAVTCLLRENGYDAGRCASLIATITEEPETHDPVRSLQRRAAESRVTDDESVVPRVLLLHAARQTLDRVDGAEGRALPSAVIGRLCDEFAFVANAGPDDRRYFEAGTSRFAGACKIATMRRFPAGQFDWEVSGVSRRDLVRVHGRSLPVALAFAAFRMGGLQPVFFSHLNPRRPNRSLVEEEANRSYYLMAQAMERQPTVKGFAACSWFRSPATQAVSPHLAWLSRVFVDNGGLVVESGQAAPDCGIFHRSATRKRLYEEGRFKPTLGLVLWPRRAMIAWAHAHPEYAP